MPNDSNEALEFPNAPLFESFNSYSLKREAVNVGNPALIWHRAYWRPSGMGEDSWHELLNRYVFETADVLRNFSKENNGFFEQKGGIDLFPNVVPLNRMSDFLSSPYTDLSSSFLYIRFNGLKITLVFEKFDEFWSLKLIVDYSRYDGESKLPDHFMHIATLLSSAESFVIEGVRDARSKADDQDLIVDQISNRISEEIVSITTILFPRLKEKNKLRSIIALDDLFANFVGFSLGISWNDDPGRLSSEKAENVSDNIRPDGIISRSDRQMKLVDAIWPLAKRLNPAFKYKKSGSMEMPEESTEEMKNDQSRREFTISTIDDGRAIYVTSLGGNRSQRPNLYYPLSYIIICPHKATWQIGRFVDRIHTLGLFRLAALKDYQIIEDAGVKIRNLSNRLYVRDDIEKISREFDSLCTTPANGLHDRVAKSAYYITLFRESLTTIKFGRIEGYQPYPEFVSRKFSGRFQTVFNISKSIEFLSQQISLHINRDNSISIRDFLEFADQVSVIPIAYYSYNVLEHGNDFLLFYLGQRCPWPWTVPWALFSLCYAAYVWIYKRFKHARRKNLALKEVSTVARVDHTPPQ